MSAHKLSVGSSFVRESMCEWNLWSHCASAPCQSKLMTKSFIPFCLKMVGSLPPVTKTSCAPSPDARSTGSSTPVHNQDDRRALSVSHNLAVEDVDPCRLNPSRIRCDACSKMAISGTAQNKCA